MAANNFGLITVRLETKKDQFGRGCYRNLVSKDSMKKPLLFPSATKVTRKRMNWFSVLISFLVFSVSEVSAII